MDGLSAAGSIIAVIQLADRIVEVASILIGHVRGADKEILQVITALTVLKGFLDCLWKLVEQDGYGGRLP